MASLAQSRFTPEEYLAIERKADRKSEYVNGCRFAMAGASREHNLIALNVGREISQQFKDRPCEAYVSDMRVKVSETGLYTYPDVVALCGEPRFEDAKLDTLLNPMVIVEVLSESTEAYDRGDTFAHYRRLESLTDYVMIAQDRVRVEHYVRQGRQWVLTEISDPNGVLQLSAIHCRVALSEIYDKVQWSDNEAGTPDRSGHGRS
jgi:Uma2 family endonuclease